MRAALRFSSLLSRPSPCMALAAKRQKMDAAIPSNGGLKIGTHSGSFHCDEALGAFLLKQTAKFAGAQVVRTREPEVIKTLDVVIDVGGVYEPGAEPPPPLVPAARTTLVLCGSFRLCGPLCLRLLTYTAQAPPAGATPCVDRGAAARPPATTLTRHALLPHLSRCRGAAV